MRGHRRTGMAAAIGLTVALAVGAAGPAESRSRTTFEQTILDEDNDNRLEPGPRDDYEVRPELGGPPSADRERNRVPQLFFGQLTDMHVVDEESPLRVEFLDRVGPPFTSAYRPHEGLSPQVLNEMVRQMRNTVSPITSDQVELVMTTGDNSDNTQLNETRWFIDLLDGDKMIDPNSGIPTPPCEATPGSIYDGVRNNNEYYEPDSSATPPTDNEDGPGYSPDPNENSAETRPPRRNSVRDFPGLFEDMNKPFRAAGLGVPWYGIFGNHDALVQGNQGRNPAYEAIATGCVKISNLSDAGLERVRDQITPAERESGFISNPGTLQAVRDVLLNPDGNGATTTVVPPDPKRRPLRKPEFIAQHAATTGTPAGHGFGMRTPPDQLALGQGYYSFNPKPDDPDKPGDQGLPLKFIVLDSIAENGGDGGNIDEEQYQWLEEELDDSQARRERVMVFAHHTLDTMDQPPVSPFAPGDQGGNMNPAVHFGTEPQVPLAPGNRRPECPTRALPEGAATETLRCQFLRHPAVVAFVAGHEHENKVLPYERDTGAGPVEGGFWEVATASHIDWPQQSRVLDLVDNLDGTLSIFGTLLDHNSAPNPGGAPAPRTAVDEGQSSGPPPSPDGRGASSEAVTRLGSISRELSFNDPDSFNGEDGRPDARGGEGDRNVELLIRDPFPGP